MSRCFPYPPPGYDKKNYKDDEALIESIKSERKKDKEKRKEKRREKKERKERDKNEKTRKNGETENKVNSHKKKRRHKDDGSNINQKDAVHPKKIENEIEQLEKSSLTEEHGQPGSVQNLSDSSDSIQNSSKRKKHMLASSDGGIHNLGSTFRIRLPLLKHKALEVPHIIKEQPSSTSRRTVILAPKQTDVAPRSSTELLCSTSGRIDIPARDKAEPASARTSSLDSGSLDIDTQYRDLFENWVSLPVQNECSDFDDHEWLFDTKQQPSRWHEAKKFKASDYASVLGSSSLWPAAYYLSEADMYALPYTVPF